MTRITDLKITLKSSVVRRGLTKSNWRWKKTFFSRKHCTVVVIWLPYNVGPKPPFPSVRFNEGPGASTQTEDAAIHCIACSPRKENGLRWKKGLIFRTFHSLFYLQRDSIVQHLLYYLYRSNIVGHPQFCVKSHSMSLLIRHKNGV